MANKSSVLLAVLFIANPFVLLFYQNCSSSSHLAHRPADISSKKPASVTSTELSKTTPNAEAKKY